MRSTNRAGSTFTIAMFRSSNVGNPYMSRCGTVFNDDEEAKLVDKIDKLRKLGTNNSNFNEMTSAFAKVKELEDKLEEIRAGRRRVFEEQERIRIDEQIVIVDKLAQRFYNLSNALQDVANKCRKNNSIKGLDEMVAYAFNATAYDPTFAGGGGLPAGKHPVTVTNGKLTPTKNNDGGMMILTLTAYDGPNKGASMDLRLNLHNKSAVAVEIANRQLAAVCACVGVPGFQQTEELYNKPFIVEVAPQKDNPQYTEIVNVYDVNGNEPGKAGSGPMQGQTTQNGGFPNNGGGGFPNGQQNGGGGFPDPNANGGQQQNTGQGGGFPQTQDNGQQQNGQGAQGAQGNAWGQNTGQGGQGTQQQGGGAGWAQGGQSAQGGATGGGTPGWGQR